MSRVVVLAAVVIDTDELDAMNGTYSDASEAVVARLDEFYPVGGNALVPRFRSALAVDPDDVRWIRDGIQIHAEAQDDRDNTVVWGLVDEVLNPALAVQA